MQSISSIQNQILSGNWDKSLSTLYSTEPPSSSRQRLLSLLEQFQTAFPNAGTVQLFSAPGRTELGGNHTDHQRGCVLAASVNLDILAAVSCNNDHCIRIQSEGYPLDCIDLSDLSPKESEKNNSASLIRGIAARFLELGYPISGFDAYTVSNVLKGSGLSSSAAFEVLIGTICNHLFCQASLSPIQIAQIGQYSENTYFGKPSGLMDQMASSVGGIVSIDFFDSVNPKVDKINFDFSASQHALCIIDTGANHSDLTDEYTAIPLEMKQIASYFGKEVLSQMEKKDLLSHLPELRSIAGDRAVLRALHFFNDHERALKEAEALRHNDFSKFLTLVRESGLSSFQYLQNVIVSGKKEEQPVAVALALCEEFLGSNGGFRVHGGGFAGTIQAFVPQELLEEFHSRMEALLGKGCCHILTIRQFGGIELSDKLSLPNEE